MATERVAVAEKKISILNYHTEVLSRAQSVSDALDTLRKGSTFFKIRDKGVRGMHVYRRKYRLDINDMKIVYTPNKSGMSKMCAGVGGGGDAESSFISLNDVAEVRAGHGTDVFNKIAKDAPNKEVPRIGTRSIARERCLSYIFKDDRPPLDLVADDKMTRDLWVDVISHLIVTIRSLGQQKEYELYLKKQFQSADKNQNKSLTFDECRALIEQLNIKMDKNDLKALFKVANKNPAKGREEEALDEGEFIIFYFSLLKRPDIEEVFNKYAHDNRMTAEDLTNFQKYEQKDDMMEEECRRLIKAYEPTPDKTTFSLEGFMHFMMFSEWQEIIDPASKTLVSQDMTKPLSHYWIKSSHNTYLLGNQVTGESSVDGYIRSLKQGCRCVELDCWDGDDGEPIIYHGWTLTSKILFKEVMRDAILKYAFYSTDYPLILSIENHCSIEQQDVMADHMRNILKDLLYTDPVNEAATTLPSPESLKRKILVKAKRLPPGKTQDDDLDEEDDDDEERDEKKKQKPKKISAKLSELVNYIHAVHFNGFEHSLREAKYWHMSSFGESKAFKFIEDEEKGKQFVRYNTKQISRIYPGASRQDSSNLKVLPPWNAGCQIVALNYQTEDKQNFYNRARFSANGRCGYILKPPFLCDPSIRYSPTSPSGLDPELFPTWKVNLTIVSGLHIPRPDGKLEGEVIDPYVKIRIRGHPDDKDTKGETDSVHNNGFNPVWKKSFNFEVKVPQLAFLEFKVKDYSKSGRDEHIGSFAAPLRNVKQGYRRVYLEDYSGKSLSPACLLVYIQIMPDGEKK